MKAGLLILSLQLSVFAHAELWDWAETSIGRNAGLHDKRPRVMSAEETNKCLSAATDIGLNAKGSLNAYLLDKSSSDKPTVYRFDLCREDGTGCMHLNQSRSVTSKSVAGTQVHYLPYFQIACELAKDKSLSRLRISEVHNGNEYRAHHNISLYDLAHSKSEIQKKFDHGSLSLFPFSPEAGASLVRTRF